jgi:hypothetical protein
VGGSALDAPWQSPQLTLEFQTGVVSAPPLGSIVPPWQYTWEQLIEPPEVFGAL